MHAYLNTLEYAFAKLYVKKNTNLRHLYYLIHKQQPTQERRKQLNLFKICFDKVMIVDVMLYKERVLSVMVV